MLALLRQNFKKLCTAFNLASSQLKFLVAFKQSSLQINSIKIKKKLISAGLLNSQAFNTNVGSEERKLNFGFLFKNP